ncbi:hypothetical protein GALL_527090 [mine drainage metagenome]|uniref:Uncharacterized protein n=1 Tax=mine drainage metagenome TaxID=410659 RepID=A0A1J5PKA9_9ZZZZ
MLSRSALATLASRSPSGLWRSISTLPLISRIPSFRASANSASTDALCTVGKTTAAVVPCASKACRKRSAPACAASGSP